MPRAYRWIFQGIATEEKLLPTKQPKKAMEALGIRPLPRLRIVAHCGNYKTWKAPLFTLTRIEQ